MFTICKVCKCVVEYNVKCCHEQNKGTSSTTTRMEIQKA